MSAGWSGRTGWPEGFAARPADRLALVVLSHLASLTPRRLLRLAQSYGTASACLAAVRRGEAGTPADRALAASVDGSAAARKLEEANVRTVAAGDDGYPSGLSDLPDPPPLLFVRGRRLDTLTPGVAVVGARNCSPTGRDVARALGRALAGASTCVVSGGARGIDSAAHRGALEAGGSTILVLGCGIDVSYPSENRKLIERASEVGALVSEYPPGTPPAAFRFPARNRLVAALARATVVVEGADGSGSLITADHALELGREVFAVPGSVTNPLAHVPLALIRDGATPIRGPEDLLADLDLPLPPAEAPLRPPGADGDSSSSSGESPRRLTGTRETVWAAITAASPADLLAARSGLPLAEVVSALAELELLGLVRQVGGRYERRLQQRRNVES